MTFDEAWKLILFILRTMKQGEIRLYVKNGRITHINRTEEVFPTDADL